MRLALARSILYSWQLVLFRVSVSSVKFLAALLVLLLYPTSTPLTSWLILHMILDLSFTMLQLVRIYYLKKAQSDASIQQPHYISLSLSLQALLYLVWLVPGNYWYYSCGDCYEESPVLSALVLFLLILGYFKIAAPTLLLLTLCVCLPVSIVFIMLITTSSQEPASEEVIDSLNRKKYSEVKLQGESTCSICATEYEEDSPVIVMHCDPKHYFHEECIKRWLRINATCPICRTSI